MIGQICCEYLLWKNVNNVLRSIASPLFGVISSVGICWAVDFYVIYIISSIIMYTS